VKERGGQGVRTGMEGKGIEMYLSQQLSLFVSRLKCVDLSKFLLGKR